MGTPGIRPVRRHRWRLEPRQAIRLQREMASQLIISGGPRSPKLIAGADVCYLKEANRCFAAIVVVALPELEVVEEVSAEAPISFPYVPGLLSFREGPAVLKALARLRCRPDLLMFDAHGLAHPRRFGLASHLGYLLDLPSIGCAKSLLVGESDEPGMRAGSYSWLIDRDQRVGAVVRTQTGKRPVYISPGHKVGIAAAVRLGLLATGRFRIPEPTRLADIMVARCKREALQKLSDGAGL